MKISKDKQNKHRREFFLIILLVFIGICVFFFSFFILACKNLEKNKSSFANLGPALYKFATGLDLPKDGKLTQQDQEIIMKKAKYIRIELDDKMRQEIKETGKVCVPFPSESVQISPLRKEDEKIKYYQYNRN